MKHLRQHFIYLICSCLVLLPCAPLNVRAQTQGDGKKIFDTYATVTTYVYPVAGAMFKATGEMLDLFGYFGNKPDPVGEALKRINERLTNLETKVATLESEMRKVKNELFRTQNRDRIRFLKDRHQDLQHLVDELREKPTERQRKRTLANDAQRIAGRFLDDPEMDIWKWNDMREKDQLMLPADFKPLPTLEYYVVTLVTWMAAIENAADGDKELAKREYGRELQKHIAFLSERPSWKDGDEAETLPENIRVRVSCGLELLHRSPNAITRKCTIHEGCEDQIARVLSTVAIHEEIMPLGTEICNVPYSARKMASENELERMYGTEVMEQLAKKLDQLKVTGSVREQFIGTFDPTTYTAQYLYGVKPNGELLWYIHRVATQKAGEPSATGQVTDVDRARTTGTRASEGQKPTGVDAAPKALGRVKLPPTGASPPRSICDTARDARARNSPAAPGLEARCRAAGGVTAAPAQPTSGTAVVSELYTDTAKSGRILTQILDKDESEVSHFLDGPKGVGAGWEDFKQVFPGGNGIVYAIAQNGNLLWYKHIDFGIGARAWEGPKEVGSGWGDFKQVFSAGDGLVYAITQEGKLLWYKHREARGPDPGYRSLGRVRSEWEGPKEVGSGWGDFKHVFPGGNGIVYAITQEGKLLWYRHLDFANGVKAWEGPKGVGTGWNFGKVFSSGEGVIYAMRPTGELLWYKHNGYKNGSVAWQGPAEVAADWKDFLFVFPNMTGTWTPPVVR
ncbi:MAG: tachylectin-related carbohydrate-binding protein [Acidobacteriota bacterium]